MNVGSFPIQDLMRTEKHRVAVQDAIHGQSRFTIILFTPFTDKTANPAQLTGIPGSTKF